MALPEFDSMSLQDDTYITSEIENRTWPSRAVETQKLSRRPGAKFVSDEFGERRIKMSGWIKGSSLSDLQTKIDTMNNVLQRPSKLLQIYSGRFYTATAVSVAIGDTHYNQSIVPYEVEFLCADPFAYGTTVNASMTVTSGTIIQTYNITIAGSYFAEPIFTYTPPAGTGNTTTSGFKVVDMTTAEYVMWSGTGSSLYIPYGSFFQVDYQYYKTLLGTTQVNQAGVFSRWEPGNHTVQVTYMGNTVGGTFSMSYAPRYL